MISIFDELYKIASAGYGLGMKDPVLYAFDKLGTDPKFEFLKQGNIDDEEEFKSRLGYYFKNTTTCGVLTNVMKLTEILNGRKAFYGTELPSGSYFEPDKNSILYWVNMLAREVINSGNGLGTNNLFGILYNGNGDTNGTKIRASIYYILEILSKSNLVSYEKPAISVTTPFCFLGRDIESIDIYGTEEGLGYLNTEDNKYYVDVYLKDYFSQIDDETVIPVYVGETKLMDGNAVRYTIPSTYKFHYGLYEIKIKELIIEKNITIGIKYNATREVPSPYPNPEVYGTSDTWSKSAIFYTVGDGDPETKTIAPRINVWDSTSSDLRKGTLSRAITSGKLTAGIPIDPTICPCGQDPTVSCFGKIGLFKNHSDSDANKIPDKIVTYENPVNWFFSEIWRYYPDARAFQPQLTDRDSDLCRWSPNENLTDLNNQNRYVTPFVYYQLKSIFANIYVNTITRYDIYGRPDHNQMTLEKWKNNYSTRKIDSAVLRLKGVTSQTGGTIAYQDGNLDDFRSVGVSLLNDVDGITDYFTYYVDRQQYFRLFGTLFANAYNTAETYYMLAYDMFENVEVKSVFESGQTQGGWCVWQEIPYSETNYEKILKMAACFGIPFSPTNKESFAAEFTDNDLYLPVVDVNGITHGEYTHGEDNLNNEFINKDSVREFYYTP